MINSYAGGATIWIGLTDAVDTRKNGTAYGCEAGDVLPGSARLTSSLMSRCNEVMKTFAQGSGVWKDQNGQVAR